MTFSVFDMEKVKLKPSALCGAVEAPPSKSDAHRALICSFLAGKMLDIPAVSDDVNATKNALSAFNDTNIIDCKESASTLRFLIPLAAVLHREITFTGSDRLFERPLNEYLRVLPEHGVKLTVKNNSLSVSGKLKAGRFEIRGDESSQYVSGLLMVLPLLDGDSEIIINSPLQSKPYVNMTAGTMARFGVTVSETENGYFIKGKQGYKSCSYILEGDWSQAAFLLAGGALTGDTTVTGLDVDSPQGDREIVEILRRFGAEVQIGNSSVRVKKAELYGIETDACDIPDLVPVIAVLGAFANGKTVITGAKRLKYKESDRLSATVDNLKNMGADAKETSDGIIINGGRVHGAELNGFNDHRIVMAFSVAAAAAEGESVITDALSINKSYPDFYSDYNSLGGKADVVCDWKKN